MKPDQALAWVRDGTRALLAEVAGLPDEALDGPTALIDDVTSRRSSKGGGPALAVAATDTGHTWEVTGTGAPVPVSAPLADLAAYLTGRPAAELTAAPVLPDWL
jgi:maleylpyruvate isomerase